MLLCLLLHYCCYPYAVVSHRTRSIIMRALTFCSSLSLCPTYTHTTLSGDKHSLVTQHAARPCTTPLVGLYNHGFSRSCPQCFPRTSLVRLIATHDALDANSLRISKPISVRDKKTLTSHSNHPLLPWTPLHNHAVYSLYLQLYFI